MVRTTPLVFTKKPGNGKFYNPEKIRLFTQTLGLHFPTGFRGFESAACKKS